MIFKEFNVTSYALWLNVLLEGTGNERTTLSLHLLTGSLMRRGRDCAGFEVFGFISMRTLVRSEVLEVYRTDIMEIN